MCFSLAEEKRADYLASLDTSKPIKLHVLNRTDVFNQLIAAYQQGDILNQFTVRIRFAGEAAIDLGGVTREAFSCFWEITYTKYFDGPRALVPSIHSGIDFNIIPTLGCILSHGYLVCGFLPVQISFPVLARILLTSNVEDHYILEAFQEYVGQQDSTILKESLQFTTQENFPPDFCERLVTTLSRYGCRQLPTTLNIKKLILEVARFHILVQPSSVIYSMKEGIPASHLAFWRNFDVQKLHVLYMALSANVKQVLKAIAEPVFLNQNEERTFHYLLQYVESMEPEELRRFLRFVTGSSTLTSVGINVCFNSLQGLARRPIAHTCSCTIELPVTYVTYLEFLNEFRGILMSGDDSTWIMDAL